MKVTPSFIAGIVLCAGPFALAVHADLKSKDHKGAAFGEYDSYRNHDDDDDDDLDEQLAEYRRRHPELDDDFKAPDYDPPPPPQTHSIGKDDLLQLVGAEPATMGPVLDGIRFGASAEDYEPDVTRERIEQYRSDHDYNVGFEFDTDDVTLNGLTMSVTGEESALRDVMIAAWGTPKRLTEDELVWVGNNGQRAVYTAMSDGFELKFEPYLSVDDFVAPNDKTKLGVEPVAIVGGSLRKLRDALGGKLQDGSYDDDVTWAMPGIGAGSGKTMMNAMYDGDKLKSLHIEGSTSDIDGIVEGLTAKWGAPKADDDGNQVWKVRGVSYRLEPFERGFTIDASK